MPAGTAPTMYCCNPCTWAQVKAISAPVRCTVMYIHTANKAHCHSVAWEDPARSPAVILGHPFQWAGELLAFTSK